LCLWNTERVENKPEQPISQPLPIEQAASPKKKYSFKKTFWIFFITSVLIAVIVGGGYIFVTKQNIFLSQNQYKTIVPTIKQPVSVPTSDPTANWKTYRNVDYGFEFKYPRNSSPYKDKVISKNIIIAIKKENYGCISSIGIKNQQISIVRTNVEKIYPIRKQKFFRQKRFLLMDVNLLNIAVLKAKWD
jgi:hypothetical protein